MFPAHCALSLFTVVVEVKDFQLYTVYSTYDVKYTCTYVTLLLRQKLYIVEYSICSIFLPMNINRDTHVLWKWGTETNGRFIKKNILKSKVI
jgi:hypothetical protein